MKKILTTAALSTALVMSGATVAMATHAQMPAETSMNSSTGAKIQVDGSVRTRGYSRLTSTAKDAAPAEAASAKAVSAKAVPAKAAVKKTGPAGKMVVASDKGRGPWAIHVASFNAEKYAERLERAIDRVGYNAYVTTFVKDGVKWHRVRVGFFSTKEDANATSAIISKRFKQPGAWLVRPPKEEVEKHKI